MRYLQFLFLGSGLLSLTLAKAPAPVAIVHLTMAKATASKTALRTRVLVAEVPGIQSEQISIAPGGSATDPAPFGEDRVYLVLAGRGELIAGSMKHPVAPETIAHFPLGVSVEVRASASESLDVLVLRQTLTPADLEDIKGYPEASRLPYVKAYRDCEAYGESIKSARTVSRTLLPKLMVPRMAIGTVETIGPDRVAPHRHPMLEQYFLGLFGSDITVLTDEIRTPLKAHDLLHIPLGSNHGAEVAEGKKLYYVWMDFFQDAKGLEWLNEHKALKPATNP